jgi:hypothetical protein
MVNGSAKTKFVGIKFTAEQYRMIEQRAERCKVSKSAWMRAVLLQAADRSATSKPGYVRIREPDGALT